jgi:hypothetical protein
MSGPAAKSKPPRRSSGANHIARDKNGLSLSRAIGSQRVVLALIGVLAATALITATSSSRRPGTPSEGAAREATLSPANVLTAAPVETVASKKPSPIGRVKSAASKPAARKSPVAPSPGQPAVALTPTTKETPVQRAPASAPVASTAVADVQAEELATITGCVARRDGAFSLKGASGADAPRSRSWKSGFLRQRTAAIQLVDPTNRWKLASYVGQRVAVTGTLVDRELRPRTLRRLAASCD